MFFSDIIQDKREDIMISRKKHKLSEQDIKEINETLDIIDISIYDLLVKRKELKEELSSVKKNTVYDLVKELSSSIQKITEQRKLDKEILIFTSSILNTSNLSNKNIEIGLQSKKDNEKFLSNIKNFFPMINSVNFKIFPKHSEIINSLLTYPNMLACIPATKTSPKDVWWIPMISPEKKNIKIVSKVPFIETDEGSNEYLITKTDSFYNFDRSVIAIATSENITQNWLKTALHKINIPLYNIIDSTAIFNGTVLHLIEISHSISSNKDAIFNLNETINGINIRIAGYLGGYFLPLVDKDKIIDFKISFSEK